MTLLRVLSFSSLAFYDRKLEFAWNSRIGCTPQQTELPFCGSLKDGKILDKIGIISVTSMKAHQPINYAYCYSTIQV
ncbi:hypothetical protein SQ11_11430 [Nitrosospira sp. NpAV]|nr:hypothetical protein SQ11_11430 [Nitrosospira sp. NpAV]